MFFQGIIFILTRNYPFHRGRDFFFRNFFKEKFLKGEFDSLPRTVTCRKGFKMLLNSRDYTSDWIQVWREHELDTEKFILRHGRNESVFLDVGSNVGYFSLCVAHCFLGKMKVHAFEPNSKIASFFRESIRLNNFQKNVYLSEFALSDENKDHFLREQSDNSGHSMVASQGIPICLKNGSDWWNSLNEKYPVSVIKIDVEGHELQVLKGLKQIILKYRPAMVVEAIEDNLNIHGSSVNELKLFLSLLGYHEEFISSDDNLYLVYKG